MTARPDISVIFETPFGLVALTLNQVSEGLDAARDLAPDAAHTEDGRSLERPVHRLVDAVSIANLFDMDSTWFLTRARENRIPYVGIGKYVRFDPVEIRDFFHHEADRLANL